MHAVVDASRTETLGAHPGRSLAEVRIAGLERFDPLACAMLRCTLHNQFDVTVDLGSELCPEAWAILAASARVGGIEYLDAWSAGPIASAAIADVVRGFWEDPRAEGNTNRIRQLAVRPVDAAVDALREALAERTEQGDPPLEYLCLRIDPAAARGCAALIRAARPQSLEVSVVSEVAPADLLAGDAAMVAVGGVLHATGPGGLGFLTCAMRCDRERPDIIHWSVCAKVLDHLRAGAGGGASAGDVLRHLYLRVWAFLLRRPHDTRLNLDVNVSDDQATADRIRTLIALSVVVDAAERTYPSPRSTNWSCVLPDRVLRNDGLRFDRLAACLVCVQSETAATVWSDVDPESSRSVYREADRFAASDAPLRTLFMDSVPRDRPDLGPWIGELHRLLSQSTLETLVVHGFVPAAVWEALVQRGQRSVRSIDVLLPPNDPAEPGFGSVVGRFAALRSIRARGVDAPTLAALRTAIRARRDRPLRLLSVATVAVRPSPPAWDGFFDDTPVISRVELHCNAAVDGPFRLGRLRLGRRLSIEGTHGVPFACAARLDDGAAPLPALRIRFYHGHIEAGDGPADIPGRFERFFEGCERIPELAHRVYIDAHLSWDAATRVAFRTACVRACNRIAGAAARANAVFRVRFDPDGAPGTGDVAVSLARARQLSDAIAADGARFPFTVFERFVSDAAAPDAGPGSR